MRQVLFSDPSESCSFDSLLSRACLLPRFPFPLFALLVAASGLRPIAKSIVPRLGLGLRHTNLSQTARGYNGSVSHAFVFSRAQAGRGTFSQGSSGWRMAPVSTPRGKSFEDAKLRFEDVQQALQEKSGTVRLFEPPKTVVWFSIALSSFLYRLECCRLLLKCQCCGGKYWGAPCGTPVCEQNGEYGGWASLCLLVVDPFRF